MLTFTRIRPMLAIAIALALAAAGCGGGQESGSAKPAPSASAPAEPAPKPAAPAAAPSGAPGPLGTATITGNVTYEGEVPPLKPISMDADPGCAKKHSGPVHSEMLVLGDGNKLANVFVRISGGLPGGSYAPPSEPAEIDQEGCQYTPHVLGVMVGQTLKIHNSDGLLHNVHALPEVNKTFNMAMPATRTDAEVTFDKPEGMFKVKCDVHPWMGAYVAVMADPFFDVTGTDGEFSIGKLPAGSYEVEVWHEKLGTKTQTVEVADGQTAEVDFTLTR